MKNACLCDFQYIFIPAGFKPTTLQSFDVWRIRYHSTATTAAIYLTKRFHFDPFGRQNWGRHLPLFHYIDITHLKARFFLQK